MGNRADLRKEKVSATTWIVKKTRKAVARNLIGRRIKQARLAAKRPVLQDDPSGRLAVRGITLDQGAVSRIENQSRYVMDYEALAIARYLKVPNDKGIGQ